MGTNLKEVLKGAMVFPIGYVISIITWYLLPPIIDFLGENVAVESVAKLQGVMYLGMILIWLCAMVIVPALMILKGMTIRKDQEVQAK